MSRRYRDQTALDDVSLTVEPGTVTGLLGRNGAGKTTLMRIITGLEFPTAGEVKVFGQAPAENEAVLRRMVFVREEQAYPDFRVRPRDPGGLVVLPELERGAGRAAARRLRAAAAAADKEACPAGCARPSASSSAWRPAPS